MKSNVLTVIDDDSYNFGLKIEGGTIVLYGHGKSATLNKYICNTFYNHCKDKIPHTPVKITDDEYYIIGSNQFDCKVVAKVFEDKFKDRALMLRLATEDQLDSLDDVWNTQDFDPDTDKWFEDKSLVTVIIKTKPFRNNFMSILAKINEI